MVIFLIFFLKNAVVIKIWGPQIDLVIVKFVMRCFIKGLHCICCLTRLFIKLLYIKKRYYVVHEIYDMSRGM